MCKHDVVMHQSPHTHIIKLKCTDLLDEGVRSVGAQQQDGSPQGVSVAVQLLGPHGGEQVGEDFTDVPVHPLQGHVHALPGRLVQETLQAADIWRNESEIYIIRNVKRSDVV